MATTPHIISNILSSKFENVQFLENNKTIADRYADCGVILFSFQHKEETIVLKYYSVENIPESEIADKIEAVNNEYEIAKIFRRNSNIVQVFRHDKIRYDNKLIGIIMYMEYFQFTLRDLINKKIEFTEDEVINFLYQMDIALSSLHQNDPQIIHFDIKPSNIGVKIKNEKSTYVLMDFDVSMKVENQDIKNKRMTSGLTPAYASPELISKYLFDEGQLDAKSDIYSVGAIAAHMMTGKPPIRRNSHEYVLPIDLCSNKWKNIFEHLCHPNIEKRSNSIKEALVFKRS